jgi:hypothetical protein
MLRVLVSGAGNRPDWPAGTTVHAQNHGDQCDAASLCNAMIPGHWIQAGMPMCMYSSLAATLNGVTCGPPVSARLCVETGDYNRWLLIGGPTLLSSVACNVM